MAMSGIDVDPEVKVLFDSIKLNKTHKYALFRISEDGKRVIHDVLGDPVVTKTKEEDFEEFKKVKELLKKEEPRYIIYDFNFTNEEGKVYNKIAFIFWCCDDGAPIKKKMVYSSTKDTVKKSFSGVGFEFQANDSDDFDYDEFTNEIIKKTK